MKINTKNSKLFQPKREIDLMLSNLVFTDEEVQQFDEINKTNKKIRKADAIVKKIDKR
jgi:hypothetical protein